MILQWEKLQKILRELNKHLSLKGKISRLDNDLIHVRDSFVVCIKNRKRELENRIQTLKYEDQQHQRAGKEGY